MKASLTLALSALLSGAAACSHNQPEPTPSYQTGVNDDGTPAGRLSFAGRVLEMRDELRLDGGQVDRLTGIKRRYEDRNRQLMGDRANASGARDNRNERSDGADRSGGRSGRGGARNADPRLRENMAAERREVEDVLTPAQRDQLVQRMRQMQENRQRRRR